MRALQIISISHKSHSTQERIALNLSEDHWSQLFTYMKHVLQVDGFVHLSTCNRIEIYFEAESDLRFKIIDKWMSLTNTEETIDTSTIKTYLGTNVCMRYLLSLSLGFHSAISGDDQIIAQLKKAFLASNSQSNISTLLERAFQGIMKCHKQICNETDYRKQTVSLAYHSLKSMYLHMSKEELSNKSLLIIGAGDMAAQVVKYISKFTFRQVSITNRTMAKAQQLSEGRAIVVANYEALDLSQYDIIISCTDQGYDMLSAECKLDFYIDLSLRSTTINELSTPHVLLPELQAYIKEENVKRFSSMGVVKRILGHHASIFSDWVQLWETRQNTAQLV